MNFTLSTSVRDFNSDIDSPHILDPRERYSLENINQQAHLIAKRNNQAVSWAFRVEALETPYGFQIIYPTNIAAYQRIQQSLSSKPVVARNAIIDEQSINTAIKTIINSSQPKSNAIENLLSSVEIVNKILDESDKQHFWQTIFNSHGADNAIKDNIQSHQIARLLTIRSMILPNKVKVFLEWLKESSQSSTKKRAS